MTGGGGGGAKFSITLPCKVNGDRASAFINTHTHKAFCRASALHHIADVTNPSRLLLLDRCWQHADCLAVYSTVATAPSEVSSERDKEMLSPQCLCLLFSQPRPPQTYGIL